MEKVDTPNGVAENKAGKGSGKERHKALKRFEELKKQYPNIETEKDIEKLKWER